MPLAAIKPINMDNIEFFYPPVSLRPSKSLHPKSITYVHCQPPTPLALSPSKSPVNFSSISQPPKRLTHPLPSNPTRSVTSSTSLPSTGSRLWSPETPGSDFDRALEELDGTVKNNRSQPLSENQRDSSGQSPTPSATSHDDSFSGNECDKSIKKEVVETASNAPLSNFQTSSLGASREEPIILDNEDIENEKMQRKDEQLANARVDVQRPPSSTEAPTSGDKCNEPNWAACGRQQKGHWEVSETPSFDILSESNHHGHFHGGTLSTLKYTDNQKSEKTKYSCPEGAPNNQQETPEANLREETSPILTDTATPPQRQSPPPPPPVLVERHGEIKEEWFVDDVLNSEIVVTKAGKLKLKYKVKWTGFDEPEWETHENLIPGCEYLVDRFYSLNPEAHSLADLRRCAKRIGSSASGSKRKKIRSG